MATEPKVALVTGGSRGIGFGIAEELAKSGFNLVINGVRPGTDIGDAVTRLEAHRGAVQYVQADISVKADRERLLQTTGECFGRLDVLVNNAGVAPTERADMLEAREESFDRLMSINLKGPYFLTQAAARWMINQTVDHAQVEGFRNYRGCIINVSSVSAFMASTNRGDYCITKAGISMATRLWAARLAEHGINVFEIQPGVVETDMTAGVREKYDRMIKDGAMLLPRWGTATDIGRAAAMLARGELTYATGQVLIIDGGLSLPRL